MHPSTRSRKDRKGNKRTKTKWERPKRQNKYRRKNKKHREKNILQMGGEKGRQSYPFVELTVKVKYHEETTNDVGICD